MAATRAVSTANAGARRPYATLEAVGDSKPYAGWSIDRALRHYSETITIRKRGAAQEMAKIFALRKSAVARIELDKLPRANVQSDMLSSDT